MSTYPLAADLLADQLDVATIKGVMERKRLTLLRTFMPADNRAAPPTWFGDADLVVVADQAVVGA